MSPTYTEQVREGVSTVTCDECGAVVVHERRHEKEHPQPSWHGYAGEVERGDFVGCWMSVLLGPTMAPAPAEYSTGEGGVLPFVRSWGYEPSDEEKEQALGSPEGWSES